MGLFSNMKKKLEEKVDKTYVKTMIVDHYEHIKMCEEADIKAGGTGDNDHIKVLYDWWEQELVKMDKSKLEPEMAKKYDEAFVLIEKYRKLRN